VGRATRMAKNSNVSKMIKKTALNAPDGTAFDQPLTTKQFQENETHSINKMNNIIEDKVSPIKILVRIIIATDSTLILIEGTKAIRNLARTEEVIHMLQADSDLL
jgi:hypothetical protein